jgi:hypothetical protein
MIEYKISAANTMYKGAKKLLKVGTYSSNSRLRARAAVCLAVARYSPVHSNWLLGPDSGKAVKQRLKHAACGPHAAPQFILCGPCTDLVLIIECDPPQCWKILLFFYCNIFFFTAQKFKEGLLPSSRLSIAVILLSGNTKDRVSRTRCSVGGNCCEGVGYFPGFSSWRTILWSGPWTVQWQY